MTVCIAASCVDAGEQKIVVCTDTRVGSALGSSELFLKEHQVGHGWRALISGEEAAMLSLVRTVRHEITKGAPKADDVDRRLKAALAARKQELADDYTKLHFCMSHNDFLKSGKTTLPDDTFRDAVRDIRRLKFGAEIILAGYIEKLPDIYTSDDDGKLHPVGHFAVVGEGEYLAASVLLRRKQNSSASLETTLYNVYEAKRFSHAVGSVGEFTLMSILTKDGNCPSVSQDRIAELKAMYEMYGPREIPTDIKFKNPLFHT